MVDDVPIRGSMIRLGQLLKLTGLIDTGAEVKAFLSTEPVWVNRRSKRNAAADSFVRVTSSGSGSASYA